MKGSVQIILACFRDEYFQMVQRVASIFRLNKYRFWPLLCLESKERVYTIKLVNVARKFVAMSDYKFLEFDRFDAKSKVF